jgi:hypothetical protein
MSKVKDERERHTERKKERTNERKKEEKEEEKRKKRSTSGVYERKEGGREEGRVIRVLFFSFLFQKKFIEKEDAGKKEMVRSGLLFIFASEEPKVT